MTSRCNETGALLADQRDRLNFYHQDQTWIDARMNALDAYHALTSYNPVPLRLSFWLRDAIGRIFGLEPISGFKGAGSLAEVKPGDKLDFFEILYASKDELAVTSRDKHLIVVVSICLDAPVGDLRRLSLVTSVKTHNLLGRAYMLPVGPAHGIIVRKMLGHISNKKFSGSNHDTASDYSKDSS